MAAVQEKSVVLSSCAFKIIMLLEIEGAQILSSAASSC
jgi:hypothetical protein